MTQDNLLPSCFGPPTWTMLHAVTLGYPEIIKNPSKDPTAQSYKKFFESLGPVLPCKWCRVNYAKNTSEIPIDNYLGSRKDIAYWLYMIHNKVNEETNVPKSQWPTFEDVYKLYDSMRADTCDPQEKSKSEVGLCAQDASAELKKRCKVEFITEKGVRTLENFGHDMDNNVFYKYWWLILIIVAIIVILVVFIIMKTRKK